MRLEDVIITLIKENDFEIDDIRDILRSTKHSLMKQADDIREYLKVLGPLTMDSDYELIKFFERQLCSIEILLDRIKRKNNG